MLIIFNKTFSFSEYNLTYINVYWNNILIWYVSYYHLIVIFSIAVHGIYDESRLL